MRSFVLGIDCMVFFMPAENRVIDPDDSANNVPQQLMYDNSGTWTYNSAFESSYLLLKTVQDVTLSLTASTADVTNRNSNGWRQMVSALKEGSVDFSVLWQPDDSLFDDLLAAYLDQCPVAFAILDGPIGGFNATCTPDTTGGNQDPYSPRCKSCGKVTGLHADFVITSFTRNEALEEGVTADVTIEPAVGMIYPEWLEIPQQKP